MLTSLPHITTSIRGKPPSAEYVDHEIIRQNQLLRQQVSDLLLIIKNRDEEIKQLTDTIKIMVEHIPKTNDPPVSSPLFTKKAIQEHKQQDIINALQHALVGRYDKARALTKELKRWHAEGYIDLNYNAKTIFDELKKLVAIPFQIAGFRKYFNSY